MSKTRSNTALGAQNLAMQIVAFDIADQLVHGLGIVFLRYRLVRTVRATDSPDADGQIRSGCSSVQASCWAPKPNPEASFAFDCEADRALALANVSPVISLIPISATQVVGARV
jgi:hypothetical protein